MHLHFLAVPRMREADTKMGVSWREIGVKARTGWHLDGFRNPRYPVDTFGEMTSVSRLAQGIALGDFARYGICPTGLFRTMRIRAGWKAWAHEEGKEKQLERKREREKAHIDIYFVDPRAFAERHSFRDGVASGAFARPGTSWERKRCLCMYPESRYTHEENSCQSPESALGAKEAVTIKIPGNEKKIHAATTRRPTSRSPHLRLDVIRLRENVCYRILFTLSLSLSSKIYFAYQSWRILQRFCT